MNDEEENVQNMFVWKRKLNKKLSLSHKKNYYTYIEIFIFMNLKFGEKIIA